MSAAKRQTTRTTPTIKFTMMMVLNTSGVRNDKSTRAS